jgi:DHA1 family inner membrane transport protein
MNRLPRLDPGTATEPIVQTPSAADGGKPSRPDDRRVSVALCAIALGAFVFGTAELVVVGVLDLIARDLGVSTGSAGLLVSAYAAGIAVGGPALAALTLHVPRRNVLLGALGAYVAGNLLAVVAVNFGMVLAARLVTGALHGLFIGAAFTVATGLVPPERMGRAISAVFGGIAVSAAVGVPLGTLIGQQVGWHATFAAIVVLGLTALLGTVAFVPDIATPSPTGTRAQARHALAPRVIAVLVVGFLLLGGQFAGLTYLANYLTHITGVSGSITAIFLLCFGIANTVGTVLGGKAADRDAAGTLVYANAILVVALIVLYVAGANPGVTAIALAAWGLVGFGLVPSLQHRVVTLAGPGAELAATLPASAVTAGIAVGSIAGGWVLAAGADAPIGLAAMLCAAVLPATWATRRLRSGRVDLKTAAVPA